MKETILLVCTAAALALSATAATAAPTKATNYETIEATCDGLGDVTIEVVNRGHWGAVRVQGTNITLIQSWATLAVTPEGSDTVVYEESHAKGNDDTDDVCRDSWIEVLEEEVTMKRWTGTLGATAVAVAMIAGSQMAATAHPTRDLGDGLPR